MDLNNIQLSDSMLTGFYANTLVEIERPLIASQPATARQQTPETTEKEPAQTVPEKPSKKNTGSKAQATAAGFLGSNQKKIIILVSHSGVPFLPDSELAFFSTILAACKFTLADVAIVNINGMPEEGISDKLKSLEASQVILFGIEPLSIGLPINFPPFQLQQFDGRTYLHGPSLAEVERNKPLKGSLWGSLKGMFGL